ncbi:hypothetical protein AYL99_11011 [Fonsecaea erecta]|uniref:Uncharacterized protein n=1 Tax=Fonsecaea erecta TaxID=1367422 RepID=A0A178Z5W5_9EURO|nr:hypothetical protein AYL99_11011 [Fonsecaea erecta]OAP54563.1 hypothetical protein AYL99_11011 [Fonsecaea erecta]
MLDSFLLCSALNTVFTLADLWKSIGPVQDGLKDKNTIFVLSHLANATSQTLLAIVLILAAALHWPTWDAVAIARGSLFCGATFEVVEIAGAIDALYLQSWSTWKKLLLAGTWAASTVGLVVTSFFLDNDDATGMSLSAVLVVINYGIRLNWACRSIPTLRPGPRKPRQRNLLDESSHTSKILLGDSLRSLLNILTTFAITALVVSFPEKQPLFYTLQILIVNMLRASNASWKLLTRWPHGGQTLAPDSDSDHSSRDEEHDLPPQAMHAWFAGW